MAEDKDEILAKIQENHVPFIKKLLLFFEKKNEKSQRHDELRSLYETFTTASVDEQVSCYNNNKKKLDKWTKMYEQMSKIKKRGAGDNEVQEESTAAKRTRTEVQTNPSSSVPTTSNNSSGFISIVSYGSVPASNVVSSTLNSTSSTMRQPSASTSNSQAMSEQEVSSGTPVTFVCASCQFNTTNETEFAQHAKNDHKNELSLWCRQCWRCFSNIGALVSHIKEQSCQKEEMIYKCGVKDCTFEVSSGQTFVHHLRHCHKGSPFIFCVHCQKIFTLPHCLVLHMQNECPYKDRNRKTPGSASESGDAQQPVPQVQPKPVIVSSVRVMTQAPARASPAAKPSTPLTTVASVQRGSSTRGHSSASRGRGRGRGRGRVRIADYSSDSDDADDPSWMPDPNESSLPVRRSARWAKKVNDARNPEIFETDVEPRKKSISSAEIQDKVLLSCPCCDFMAAIKTVLEDHYIGMHKTKEKNTCLVCKVKFENTKFFLDHFENHPKVDISPPLEEPLVSKTTRKAPEIVKSARSSTVNNSSRTPVVNNIAKVTTPAPTPAVKSNTVSSMATGGYVANSREILGMDSDGLECVVERVVSNENVDVSRDQPLITIPYQAAIHRKNQKDAKLKKFEDLKSPRDLLSMKEDPNLKHFFKCVMYNCTFTTDEGDTFAFHIDNDHKGRRLHCGYCLTEYFSGSHLKEHMMKDHGKRRFQCSNCFYRACSKAHVQIHIKNMHPSEDAQIRTCDGQPAIDSTDDTDEITKTWPFVCAVGDCKFQTFVPQEFKRHNESVHRAVSVFICYYCKVDFISFKRLMDHYRLHGINTYQCTYCVHGSDTKDEILLHLCNVHADKAFRIHYRTAESNIPGGTIQSIRVSGSNPSRDESSSSQNTAPASSTELSKLLSSSKSAPIDQPTVEKIKASSTKPVEAEVPFSLKAIKQEKQDDSIEDKYYDHVDGKCFPKEVHRISSDFFCGIPYCEQQCDNLSFYITHLKKFHFSLNYSCPHCPTFSEDMQSFKNHLLCHGPNLYACSNKTCQFHDWDSGKVDSHTKECGRESSKIVVREYIDDGSGASAELAKLQTASFEPISKVGSESFNCPFCEYKSSHRGTMKNHIYMEISYKRFTCNICVVKLCSRKEVNKHFSALHVDANVDCKMESNYEIESVVKKFLSERVDLNKATSDSCENCSKSFTDSKELQHHIRLCFLNQYCPYDCNYCKKSFNDLRLLKFHFDNKHRTNNISFTMIMSAKVEEEIARKLRQARLNHVNEIIGKQFCEDKKNLFQSFKSKLYKCEGCDYRSNFKFDIEEHINTNHGNKPFKIEKIESSLNSLHDFAVRSSENNKPLWQTSNDKRYRCSYCVKKALDLQELENHIESHHPIRDEAQLSYFYWPEDDLEFSPNDTELYACGYCNISKANLHSLKKHSDLLHSEMAFKVKGILSRRREINRSTLCGHCYQRVQYSDLKKHSAASHPSMPVKSINDFQNVSLKRKLDAGEISLAKKVKFEPSAVSCMHCKGMFTTIQEVTTHSHRQHARLPVKYEGLSSMPKKGNPRDFIFEECEFCSYISSKEHLEKHIAAKHKMVVSCHYCGKRFDSATKLKEHHDSEHMGMRWTIESSKTYGSASTQKLSASSPQKAPSSSMPLELPVIESHYGKSPEPVDLSDLMFCVENQGQYVTLPLVYLFQMYDMNPVVVAKDYMKEKK